MRKVGGVLYQPKEMYFKKVNNLIRYKIVRKSGKSQTISSDFWKVLE